MSHAETVHGRRDDVWAMFGLGTARLLRHWNTGKQRFEMRDDTKVLVEFGFAAPPCSVLNLVPGSDKSWE